LVAKLRLAWRRLRRVALLPGPLARSGFLCSLRAWRALRSLDGQAALGVAALAPGRLASRACGPKCLWWLWTFGIAPR